MSNTNNNMKTQTSNTLHNAIMEAGSKDRPPMLAPVSEGSPITTTARIHETYKNVLQEIRDQLNAEAEVVQIILTGIDNDIYSIVDACPNACEMWKSIKRFYKMMNELIRNQCKVTNHQVNVQFLLQLQPEWQRAEKITRVANPPVLVAQQQLLYHSQNHPTHYTQNSSTKSQQAATRNRGKAMVNSLQPIYDQEPSMVYEANETSKDKEIDKLIALISLSFKKIYKPTNNNLRTSSNTSRANQDNSPRINRNARYENQRIGNVARARETVGSTVVQKSGIQCYNYKEFGHVARECQKPKRAKDAAYHREKMLLSHYMYMAQLQEVSPDAVDSGPIFDDEPLQKVSNDDYYNVFSIESVHPEQSKPMLDTYPIEQDAQNVIIDSLDMSDNREEIDQNDDDNDLAKEHELLASLIEKLKCEIEDFKNKNKSLESSNNFFKEANNRLFETNNLLYADYKKSEAELARRNSKEYASQMELECTKVRGDLLSYKMDYHKSCTKYTDTINALNQTILEMKDKLSAHQETISILLQQKEAQIKLYKTQEDKELEKVTELENKVNVLDNIVYKTGQSVQTMNMLNNKCQTIFAKPEFLKKAQRANPHLYDIGCYNDNLALMLAPDSDEVIRLEKERQSKLSDLIRLFDYDKLNNLCLNEEMVTDLRYFNSLELEVDSLRYQLETQKTQFLNEIDRLSREYYYDNHMNAILGVYTELDKVTNLQCGYLELLEKCEGLETQLSKSKMMSKSFESVLKHAINLELELRQCKEKIKNDMLFKLQDKGIVISELKKLIAKLKGKSVDTKFEKSSVIRQPNAFKSQRPSVLGKPTTLSNSFVRKDFSKSKPQLKSNPQKDRVMHNNSQGKKQEVENQCRSVKLSKNKTSVTTCNDSLNAKTLNVKSMCATYDTCMLNDKHDMCVLKSVAKPIKKTVASKSNQKPRNFTRKLYEHVSKTCSWWYSKFTPSGYKWKPKSGKENVNPNVNMPLENASRIANVMDTMTSRRSTVSNTQLSSNSFAARRDCPIHRRLWVLKAHDEKSKLLINFVEKFLGTVKFGNDQIAPILGYGNLVQGAVTIKRGNDLLIGSRRTDLYSITLQDTNCPNPICLMAKATSSQAWLWHRRLSHLNFDTINLLSKNDIMVGLPKLKFVKDHLCSFCELGKAK
nr:hypothetical protein [Tanacetum cinerariifolium]